MQRELTNQDINMKSRKKINLTGIKKINSLNNEEFIVIDTAGMRKKGKIYEKTYFCVFIK